MPEFGAASALPGEIKTTADAVRRWQDWSLALRAVTGDAAQSRGHSRLVRGADADAEFGPASALPGEIETTGRRGAALAGLVAGTARGDRRCGGRPRSFPAGPVGRCRCRVRCRFGAAGRNAFNFEPGRRHGSPSGRGSGRSHAAVDRRDVRHAVWRRPCIGWSAGSTATLEAGIRSGGAGVLAAMDEIVAGVACAGLRGGGSGVRQRPRQPEHRPGDERSTLI